MLAFVSGTWSRSSEEILARQVGCCQCAVDNTRRLAVRGDLDCACLPLDVLSHESAKTRSSPFHRRECFHQQARIASTFLLYVPSALVFLVALFVRGFELWSLRPRLFSPGFLDISFFFSTASLSLRLPAFPRYGNAGVCKRLNAARTHPPLLEARAQLAGCPRTAYLPPVQLFNVGRCPTPAPFSSCPTDLLRNPLLPHTWSQSPAAGKTTAPRMAHPPRSPDARPQTFGGPHDR